MVEQLKTDNYYLYPGAIFADTSPHVVTTVLGSCVSVCLWDPVNRIGGINHYMLPFWNGHGLATPRYGSIAIEKLLEKMFELGCKKENLIAKVFGGAKVLNTKSNYLDIGNNNINIAKSILAQKNIQILSNSTGGEQGRKLKFYTESGVVLMKFLNKSYSDTP